MQRRTAFQSCLALGLALAVAGCDDKSKPKQPAPISASAAVASASATAPASASAAPPIDPAKAETWTGTYDSKHVTLETPDKVKDHTWKNDDGTQAVGRGQLSMKVKDGTVSGDATGPLGPQKLAGVLEDGTLRLRVLPEDPTSATAMTGSGVGLLKDGVYAGKLRCSGPKGVVVREVSFELEPVR